jgi:hypothetical protein
MDKKFCPKIKEARKFLKGGLKKGIVSIMQSFPILIWKNVAA